MSAILPLAGLDTEPSPGHTNPFEHKTHVTLVR